MSRSFYGRGIKQFYVKDVTGFMPCDYNQLVASAIAEMLPGSRMYVSARYFQHGDTTILLHSAAVTAMSIRLMDLVHVPYDRESLLRGGLLHDYFLYDWHDPDPSHKWHGFHHADKALANAKEDFPLNDIEADIISHHMFPLVLRLPRHREAWAVVLSDKMCGLYETVCRNTYPDLRIQLAQLQDIIAESEGERNDL